MSTLPYDSAIVTGASSGIGAALARKLVHQGIQSLVLVARRGDRLQSLADSLNVSTQVIAADLTSSDGIQAVTDQVETTDLLVNNAGFATFGPFHSLPVDRELDMVRLNCMAPLALTAHYLPGMIARGTGGILNIASGQSFQAMPYMSTYAASKAFLLHWAEGVRAEMHGTGVRIVTVCPGAIATEFNQIAAIPETDLGVMSLVTGDLDDVLDAAVDGLHANQGIKIPGIKNRLAIALGKLTPRGVSPWFLARLLRSAAHRLPGPTAQ